MDFTHTFIKVKNDHERIRSDCIEGFFNKKPTVGEQFWFYGEPFEVGFGGYRIVNTSVVKELTELDTGWELHTESGSTYRVIEL